MICCGREPAVAGENYCPGLDGVGGGADECKDRACTISEACVGLL